MRYLLFVLILLSMSCAGDVLQFDETNATMWRITNSLSYIHDKKNGLCWATFYQGGLQPLDCSAIKALVK